MYEFPTLVSAHSMDRLAVGSAEFECSWTGTGIGTDAAVCDVVCGAGSGAGVGIVADAGVDEAVFVAGRASQPADAGDSVGQFGLPPQG